MIIGGRTGVGAAVLDLNLPGKDGWDAIQELRHMGLQTAMITGDNRRTGESHTD